MSTIEIVLADDHRIVRQGVKALLENEPDFSIVGEAGDGLRAVEITAQLRPHILVVDLMMPSLNGLEVIRQVAKLSAKTRAIMLSMYMNEPYVLEALRNGAYGYVLKESDMSDLIHAIREASAGRRYLGHPLSERAMEAYLEKTADTYLDLYDMLTTREREVFQLAVDGHTNSEIAASLFISPRTVEIHKANMMRKLCLRTHTDLIKYALKRGLIPMEE
ncbi:MAG: response regulator transcription factor [Syntrophorhabdales bacterium]|jgi:DNA-binding NarL/FixJ family response regulator